MAVVVPRSWADSNIDNAVPSDPAPLLAVALALDERRAVAHTHGIPPGYSFSPGDAIRYSCVEACRAIMRSIVFLRSYFVNPHTPYSDENWRYYPDHLESTYRYARYGVRPWDLLGVDPPPPIPEPGESDWSVERYRSFLRWVRRCLSAMCVVEARSAWSIGTYRGVTDPPPASSFVPSVGGGPGFYGNWSYDLPGVWKPAAFRVPAGLVVANEAGIDAEARVVMCGMYPSPGQDPWTGDWTVNASWFAGSLGPVSSARATVPGFSSAAVLSAAETLSASGASLPPPTNASQCYAEAFMVATLDYSSHFKFP